MPEDTRKQKLSDAQFGAENGFSRRFDRGVKIFMILLCLAIVGICFSPLWSAPPDRREEKAARLVCVERCVNGIAWGKFVCNEYCSGRLQKCLPE